MPYLLCRQRVTDFAQWKAVFESHATAQREAGLHVRQVWRNVDDADELFMLFEVTDITKARSFVASPDILKAVEESGALGRADLYFLE